MLGWLVFIFRKCYFWTRKTLVRRCLSRLDFFEVSVTKVFDGLNQAFNFFYLVDVGLCEGLEKYIKHPAVVVKQDLPLIRFLIWHMLQYFFGLKLSWLLDYPWLRLDWTGSCRKNGNVLLLLSCFNALLGFLEINLNSLEIRDRFKGCNSVFMEHLSENIVLNYSAVN